MNRLLALAALVCLTSLPAQAVDDPALPDGGGRVAPTDGGSFITVDTSRTTGWAMALRCEGTSARYRMCEANVARCCATSEDGGVYGLDGGLLYDGGQNLGQGTCSVGVDNQFLNADITYDINVPANRRFLSLLFSATTSSDGGVPGCVTQVVTP